MKNSGGQECWKPWFAEERSVRQAALIQAPPCTSGEAAYGFPHLMGSAVPSSPGSEPNPLWKADFLLQQLEQASVQARTQHIGWEWARGILHRALWHGSGWLTYQLTAS